jgi:hypothetical protein
MPGRCPENWIWRKTCPSTCHSRWYCWVAWSVLIYVRESETMQIKLTWLT